MWADAQIMQSTTVSRWSIVVCCCVAYWWLNKIPVGVPEITMLLEFTTFTIQAIGVVPRCPYVIKMKPRPYPAANPLRHCQAVGCRFHHQIMTNRASRSPACLRHALVRVGVRSAVCGPHHWSCTNALPGEVCEILGQLADCHDG